MEMRRDFFRGLLIFIQVHIILALSTVYADITVKNRNGSELLSMDSLQADFGPTVPEDGIMGYVVNVHPPNACHPVSPPPDVNITAVWIALIIRENCTFTEKVRNVQVGYAAAIVYNKRGDNTVIPMRGDGTGVNIPSVFVGWSDGQMLNSTYCYNCIPVLDPEMPERGAYTATITRDFSYNPYLLWPFAVVVGTCFLLMLIFLVVKWCRDIRKRRKNRLSSKHLKKIPTKKFKKGDEYDVCAICLDDYEEGDKLRLLPCSHVYHTKCIDPWLTKNKRSCPICKRKVIPGPDPDDSDSDESSDDGYTGETSNERTPLLGNNAGTSRNRRSTFDNSGLPEQVRQPEVSHVNEQRRGRPQNTDSDSDDDDSDLSDSEQGAVGGAQIPHLSKENPLLSFNRSHEFPSTSGATTCNGNDNSQQEQETVVVETNSGAGADNSGYIIDGEDGESDEDEDFNFPEDDVVFSEAGKKDEKKLNGVI